jgi:hypothetical protein
MTSKRHIDSETLRKYRGCDEFDVGDFFEEFLVVSGVKDDGIIRNIFQFSLAPLLPVFAIASALAFLLTLGSYKKQVSEKQFVDIL